MSSIQVDFGGRVSLWIADKGASIQTVGETFAGWVKNNRTVMFALTRDDGSPDGVHIVDFGVVAEVRVFETDKSPGTACRVVLDDARTS
jgi:hypothetical protein